MAFKSEAVEYREIASALMRCMFHVEPLVGVADLSAHEVEDVRSLLASLKEVGSPHADAVLTLAVCNHAIKEKAEAQRYYALALDGPNVEVAAYYYAIFLMQEDKFEAAIHLMETYTGEAYLDLELKGDLYLALERLEESYDSYQRALDRVVQKNPAPCAEQGCWKEPESGVAVKTGMAAIRLGRNKAACSILLEYSRRNPGSVELREALVSAGCS